MRPRLYNPGLPKLLSICLALSGILAAQNLGKGRGAIERGPVDLGQLTARSSVIVRGIVSAGEPRWIGRVIYTNYTLQVQETLKGPPRSSLTIAIPGGALGNVKLMIPGAPELRAGDEVVFFGEDFPGQAAFRPVGTFDGVVPVRPGVGNSAATVAPRGVPENLEDFLNEVRGQGRQP